MPSVTLPYNYKPRSYQLDFLKAVDRSKDPYKFACIVWARRHGKDITCWNYAIKRAYEEVMDVTYVYPTSEMAKNNLWEAKTNDGFLFTDFIPPAIRKRRGKADDGLNDTYKQVELTNGSIIRLASAERPDRLRGGNSKLYILSEFAEMDPMVLDVIEPVIEANGGQIIVNFTPKGDNHAKGSWQSWQADKDWFTSIVTARDTDVFTVEQLERIRRRIILRFREQGRSESEGIAFFEQEYLCSFDTPVIGSYYGEQIRTAEQENRIGNVPYEPQLKVNTYWDLGVDDSMTIWFVQQAGREIRFIDYYENSGEGLPHYIKMLQDKPYVYGEHYAPHDIKVRELTSGKSRLDTAKSLGINFRIAPKLSVEDGIDRTRIILTRSWFDAKKCERGIKAIKNYHKEWNDKTKTYQNHPAHDWSSHGADALRYAAVSIQDTTVRAEAISDEIPSYALTTSRLDMPVRNNYGRRV